MHIWRAFGHADVDTSATRRINRWGQSARSEKCIGRSRCHRTRLRTGSSAAQHARQDAARSGAIRAPRVSDDSCVEAHTLALELNEPIFVPVRTFTDDRGWSLMNLLTGVLTERGQVNYSVQYPGVVKAWHRHRLQTDFWICVNGNLKAGIWREDDDTRWMQISGEKRPGILIIPPGLWHGATALGGVEAGLLYFVTHAFNAATPDEQRREWDSVPGFPWQVRHG